MAIAKKKKRFFEVDMPIINKTTSLQAYEPKELNNRIITYDLTRILRGKNIILQLKTKVEGEKITSNPRELKILPTYLKRMIRKGSNYVEDSFFIECKNAKLKIKPFLITRKKVSRKVRKALREKAKEELIKYIKTKKYQDIFDDILKNKLQKELSLKLKKVYPLSLCEIRRLKLEEELEEKSPESITSTKKEISKEKPKKESSKK